MKPGRTNTRKLMNKLGNPQDSLKFIHVAGTNGKGTVCSLIASVLTQEGYTTGLYTSPFIVDFRERIRVNMKMITPDELESVTEKVKKAVDELNSEGVTITEFEAVTAAGFEYFKEKKCDFVVLETGLGGRFDSTNIIKSPLCSVITSISMDHMAILGDTIEKIACEKSGIIKRGCPVVTSSRQPADAIQVIMKTAFQNGSPLFISDFSKIKTEREDIFGSDVIYKGRKYHIPFPGDIQRENFSVAIKTLEVIKKNEPYEKVYEGIAETKNPARTEIISKHPMIILDGCHNEGSAKALRNTIENYLKDKKIHAFTGMMKDKDINKFADILSPCFDKVTCVKPSNPRSEDTESLAEIYRSRNIETDTSTISKEDLEKAVKSTTDNEVLIVCGSLYLCSDVRENLIDIVNKL